MNRAEQEVLSRIITKLESIPFQNWSKYPVDTTDWEAVRAFEAEISNDSVESKWVILQKLSTDAQKLEEFELRLINSDGESNKWWVFRENNPEYDRIKEIINQLLE